MTLLWRDQWLKPLTEGDAGTEKCAFCKKKFGKIEFVTSCDFCHIGIMHDICANKHILGKHMADVENKIENHRDKPLHDFQ